MILKERVKILQKLHHWVSLLPKNIKLLVVNKFIPQSNSMKSLLLYILLFVSCIAAAQPNIEFEKSNFSNQKDQFKEARKNFDAGKEFFINGFKFYLSDQAFYVNTHHYLPV